MIENIVGESWAPILHNEFLKGYLQQISLWISQVRNTRTVYPDKEDTFRALKLCPYGQVKVVILGQDPYYDGTADGLAFSYKSGIRPPYKKKSLDIILDEIERDCYEGFNVNREYQLDYLAKQGVLLLNTILTVFKGQALSHKELGWQELTNRIIVSQIVEPSPKVFLLWGNEAKNTFNNLSNIVVDIGYVKNIPIPYLLSKHLILEAKHPAADLYNADQFGNIVSDYPNTFSGCKHFSQTNEFLMKHQISPINWFPTYEPFFNEDFANKYCPI